MNFYFEAVNVLDKLDAKKGSIKGVLASIPEKNRKRTAALVIETLKCEPDPYSVSPVRFTYTFASRQTSRSWAR